MKDEPRRFFFILHPSSFILVFQGRSAASVTEPADREPGASLLYAATSLTWLAPAASSLTLLARAPASAWAAVRQDPGAALLLLRSTSSPESPLPFPHDLLTHPAVLENAAQLL